MYKKEIKSLIYLIALSMIYVAISLILFFYADKKLIYNHCFFSIGFLTIVGYKILFAYNRKKNPVYRPSERRKGEYIAVYVLMTVLAVMNLISLVVWLIK